MSEMSPEGQVEEGAVAVPKPSVGERLRAAREAQGLDAEAVASSLKLSKRQIDALEAGDWAKLPGHTFIRGFVRNYARVVKLEVDELLVDLDAPAPAKPRLDLPQSSKAVMPETGRVQKRDYATVLVGIVLVTIAVVAYYLVPSDFWQTKPREVPAVASTKPEPLFPPATVAGSDSASPADVAVPSPVASEPPPAGSEAPPARVTATPPVPATSVNALKLRFAQPSWVEIRDRSGQIIHSQLNPAGSEREVAGQPPYALIVGNAGNVTVQYQGRNIELQPRSKDDVARVTVE